MTGAVAGGGARANLGLAAILRKLDTLLCLLLALAMAVMLMAALVQVAARYVTHMTVIGPEEIARYMMLGSTFLAIPVLGYRRNHIAVDALAHVLPTATSKLWLHRLILALELAFLLVFAVLSWQMVSTSFAHDQKSIGLDVPLAWPLSTVAIGAFLGVLVTAAMLVDALSPNPVEPVIDHEIAEVEGVL